MNRKTFGEITSVTGLLVLGFALGVHLGYWGVLMGVGLVLYIEGSFVRHDLLRW